MFGDSAIVTIKLCLMIDGQARTMRGNFVAHQEGAQWKLASVQDTPIRSNPNP